MRTFTISARDLARCPYTILSAEHWTEDGTCKCKPTNERPTMSDMTLGPEPEPIEDDDQPECPMCDGAGVLLGQLGHTNCYRCRQCRITFSVGA